MPVAGQLVLRPSAVIWSFISMIGVALGSERSRLHRPGSEGTKVPVCREPAILKWYQTSFSARFRHRMVTGAAWAFARAAWISSSVYVSVCEGTIPALASVLSIAVSQIKFK